MKLQYFGHVTRGSAGNMALTVLEGSVDGLRHQGRPERQWMDDIEECSGCSYIQPKEMSQDREQWRRKTIEWSSAVANRHRRWSTSEWVSARQYIQQLFFEILGLKRIGTMTLTFQVAWRRRLHDLSISHMLFPMCFFRQLFGKPTVLATIHTLQTDNQTDRQTDDRRTQHCCHFLKHSVVKNVYVMRTVCWNAVSVQWAHLAVGSRRSARAFWWGLSGSIVPARRQMPTAS